VVVKLPRWAFEKFPGVDPALGPQMKSVGEAMAMGRTFKEALLKGLGSLELSRPPYPTPECAVWDGTLTSLSAPRAERIWAVWEALRAGHTPDEIAAASRIDAWYLAQIAEIVALEAQIAACVTSPDSPSLPAGREPGGEVFSSSSRVERGLGGEVFSPSPRVERGPGGEVFSPIPASLLRAAKRMGFGDDHIAWLLSPSLNPSLRGEGLDSPPDSPSPHLERGPGVR
jgi:hypothetical protein